MLYVLEVLFLECRATRSLDLYSVLLLGKFNVSKIKNNNYWDIVLRSSDLYSILPRNFNVLNRSVGM